VNGEVVVVILAAGAGRRLGGTAKALLSLGPLPEPDGTFLAHLAATAAEAGAGRSVVVVGPPHGARVAAEALRLGLEVADNPEPERGMGSSVAIGFEHAARRFGAAVAALLWPADHARVSPVTVAWLVNEAGPGAILVPTWRGRGGHPTAFGRELWADLAGCGALPRGARSLLERRADRVRRIEVADPGVVADVDRPGDLR
jgi:molybdenum cofactor cytidylyltransferase